MIYNKNDDLEKKVMNFMINYDAFPKVMIVGTLVPTNISV
jgi:hypothetical protein